MAKINEIIELLEEFAPLETQEEWDNSGWQINLGIKNTQKIMLALNVTQDVLKQAIEQKCDLIISHHPIIFKPLKCIKNKVIISAIQNKIQVYSAHTNFDKSSIGTTQMLVETLKKPLELRTIKPLNDFVKIASLKTPLRLEDFVSKIKTTLNLDYVKVSNPEKEVKTVAFCAGAGADFAYDVKQKNIDCFITGDVKYHQAMDCGMIVDIGHFESEIISLKSMEKLLNKLDVEIVISKEEPVFEII